MTVSLGENIHAGNVRVGTLRFEDGTALSSAPAGGGGGSGGGVPPTDTTGLGNVQNFVMMDAADRTQTKASNVVNEYTSNTTTTTWWSLIGGGLSSIAFRMRTDQDPSNSLPRLHFGPGDPVYGTPDAVSIRANGHVGINEQDPTDHLVVGGSMNVTEKIALGGGVNKSYGSAGQYLTSGGPGANATWTNPASGGGGSTSFVGFRAGFEGPITNNAFLNHSIADLYPSSGYTQGATAYRTLVFPDVVFDTNSAYDSTNGIFTAPQTGYYALTCTQLLEVRVNSFLYSLQLIKKSGATTTVMARKMIRGPHELTGTLYARDTCFLHSVFHATADETFEMQYALYYGGTAGNQDFLWWPDKADSGGTSSPMEGMNEFSINFIGA